MDTVDKIIEGLNIFKKYGEVRIKLVFGELLTHIYEVGTDDHKRLEEIGWRRVDTGWSLLC